MLTNQQLDGLLLIQTDSSSEEIYVFTSLKIIERVLLSLLVTKYHCISCKQMVIEQLAWFAISGRLNEVNKISYLPYSLLAELCTAASHAPTC